jgi:hypothetical protein
MELRYWYNRVRLGLSTFAKDTQALLWQYVFRVIWKNRHEGAG